MSISAAIKVQVSMNMSQVWPSSTKWPLCWPRAYANVGLEAEFGADHGTIKAIAIDIDIGSRYIVIS